MNITNLNAKCTLSIYVLKIIIQYCAHYFFFFSADCCSSARTLLYDTYYIANVILGIESEV